MDSACLRLKALGAAIRCHQYSYKESVKWFPDIKLGKCVDAATLATQTEAALAVRQLGLQHQSVASIPQSVEKIERLRKAVLAATEAFQNLFEPWPLLPPETLEEIQQAKALFLLLLKLMPRPLKRQSSKAGSYGNFGSTTPNGLHFATCRTPRLLRRNGGNCALLPGTGGAGFQADITRHGMPSAHF
jgi:hypothetical protein